MSLQEAQQFVARFITGEYAPEEYAAFLQWLKKTTVEELTIIADTHETMQGNWVLPGEPSTEWVMEMERKLDKSVEEREDGVIAPVIEMQPRRMVRWNGWMTAAAVVVVLSAGTFIYVHEMRSGSGVMASREKLLSMSFANPRGGAQKELVLEDGSKVWLNAASVLKYPPYFTGSERLVELSGEAFFEVSGSSGSPFRVLIKDAEVEVLGTYFTIMAYEDEPVSHTTLVDGAVKVTSGQQSKELKPGQQAEIAYSSPGVGAKINVRSGINPNSVLAWKGGIYRFENADLHPIMREMGRVYNVTIQYQQDIACPAIGGMLDLNKGLDAALKQLESVLLYKIHFTHDGKTVLVSPT
jgi:ferric-dicitrate binding protein FerR (iron transport regulator)